MAAAAATADLRVAIGRLVNQLTVHRRIEWEDGLQAQQRVMATDAGARRLDQAEEGCGLAAIGAGLTNTAATAGMDSLAASRRRRR